MTSKILKSILSVAVAVLLSAIVIITGVLYRYFGNIQQSHRITIYFDGKETSNYNTGLGAFTLNYSPNDDLNLKFIASAYSAV